MYVRGPNLTFLLAITAVALHFAPGIATILEFDRVAIGQGQLWRWITGHVTHFDADQLIWDVGALLVLGCYAETTDAARYRVGMALAAIAITSAIWLWQPHFTTYRGLSGLDTAAFGVIAGALTRRQSEAAKLTGAVAILGVALKCVFELQTGSTVFAEGLSYAPVPLAHGIGLLVGIAVSAWPFLSRRSPTTSGTINVRVRFTRSPRSRALRSELRSVLETVTFGPSEVPAGSQASPSGWKRCASRLRRACELILWQK